MASQYYGLDRGQHQQQAQTGAADLALDVQIVVDLSSSITRSEVIAKIKELENRILEGSWPPA